MTLLRRILPLALVPVLLVTGSAAPAFSATDYRRAVDITFPVKGAVRYSNDYANPRSGGRVHRATDLFASGGQRVVAARGGTIIWLPTSQSGSAGYAIQVLGDDGRVYAYYHLGPDGGGLGRAVAPGLRAGTRVSRGQLLGWLGDSGNAAGGAPHVHFEIHDSSVRDPYGTTRVNPYASLRRAQGLGADVSAPPAATAPTGWALRLGKRGPRVERWQRRLNASNRVPNITVDGDFGPGTHAATVAFQKSMGLGPAGLGVVGPYTRAAMRRVLGETRSPAPSRPAPPRREAPKPAPATTSSTALLRLGDSGSAVTLWQRKLNRSNRVPNIAADGAFGPGTHAATIAFQKSVGLGPAGLGVVGPMTRAAMRRVLN